MISAPASPTVNANVSIQSPILAVLSTPNPIQPITITARRFTRSTMHGNSHFRASAPLFANRSVMTPSSLSHEPKLTSNVPVISNYNTLHPVRKLANRAIEHEHAAIDNMSPMITKDETLLTISTIASTGLKKLKTFHQFPKLPIELRLKIWKLGILDGQIIEVRFGGWRRTTFTTSIYAHPGCRLEDQSIVKIRQYRPFPRTKSYHDFLMPRIPAILHVSQEARAEVLESYFKLANGKTAGNNVYFNPNVDTLFLRGHASSTGFHWNTSQMHRFIDALPYVELISKIAIMDAHKLMDITTESIPIIMKFPGLKEAVLLEGKAHPVRDQYCTCGGPGGKLSCFRNCEADEYKCNKAIAELFQKAAEAGALDRYLDGKWKGNWKPPRFTYQTVHLDFVADNEFYLMNLSDPVGKVKEEAEGASDASTLESGITIID